ncbi:MAG: TrkH family potassium uptake protein, partial [Sedimentisphaerales bacterium]|nr:TrkH family potassium uptake protein [Sedimentisphaerales bacterium]
NEPDKKKVMYRKEAIAVVGLGWLICGLLGSLPFLLSGVLDSIYPTWPGRIAAAVFESVSGFTTTGASIFPEPESLPRAILFWRSFTHWLGGMGIVVLFVAILSQTGPAAKFMFNSEVPGPKSADSIRPRIRQTAMLLWKIYLGLSLAETILLMGFGMTLFDALCHTFATLSSGGFSTKNASIGHFGLGIEIIIIIFMFLAGTNFNLYADIIQGKWRLIFKNTEFRVYVGLLFFATMIITYDIISHQSAIYSLGQALNSACFQVMSLMTCTGFCSDDYDKWPELSRWLLIMLMMIGGSAGSTSGGIKVFRIMIFFRIILDEVSKTFRPSLIKPVHIGKQPIDDNQCRAIGVYLGTYLLIAFTSSLLILFLESDNGVDIETSFSAVVSSMSNVGPGLHKVGPMANFSFFAPTTKLLLSFLMILGRLEVMAIFCLFTPAFWRK